MDQKQLYEQQVLKEPRNDPALSLGQREAALLNWISTAAKERLGVTNAQVAELSIGDGQLSRGLARLHSSMRIDCIDISPTRLAEAQRIAAKDSSIAHRLNFLEINLDTGFELLEK